MSRSAEFTCDHCGAKCPADPEFPHKPVAPEWLQITIAPFHAEHPQKIPVVIRDLCSAACSIKYLKVIAERIAELRKESTK